MSFLLREANIHSLVAYLILTAAWAVGGWLIVTSLFRLPPRSRLVSGIAAGLLLFQVGVNLVTRITGLPGASWLVSALILGGGLVCLLFTPGWKEKLKESLAAWPQLVFLAGLTYLFYLLGRGTSLFDDYEHLPLISVMATGDIPPHFYLNPAQYFAYHYGLQVWAASLVRMVGAFPWTAWDFAKAFAIALTLLLGWAWVRQLTRSWAAATLGSFVFVFAGGARWLLLLIPIPVLAWIQKAITLTNTGAASGANLIQALSGPWVAEGLGRVPVPFAFHSGFFLPVEFYLGATGAIPFATVLLLLLLKVPHQRAIPATLFLGLIFASLALNAEHIFVFLCGLIALIMAGHALLRILRKAPVEKALLLNWLVILAVGGVLSLVQGGFITEAARSFLSRLGSSLGQSNNLYQFSLRWPPSLTSGHLGDLSPFNLRQLPVLLAELGPAILFIPLVTHWAWRSARRGEWLVAGLGFSALASLLFALFFQYGMDRSSTRLPGTALWLWVVLAFPLLWWWLRCRGAWNQALVWVALGALVFEGVVTFAVQLTTVTEPQDAYFIDNVDAAFTRAYWNKLKPGAQVLDDVPYRAVTVFGRAVKASQSIFEPLPEWQALVKNPDPRLVAGADYAYIYMDNQWWQQVPSQTQALYQLPCVHEVAMKSDPANPRGDYRVLWNVQACKGP